jgi:hypothetical protein
MASMDGHRFDTLTRTLATGTSRRALLGGMLGGATLFGLGGRGALAKAGKTTICHQTDSGFNVIAVANPALDAHYGHGDFAYTDCCTDDECATYSICASGSCTPVCTDDQCPEGYACQDGVCTETLCLAPSDPCGAPNTACCVEQETGLATCSTTANSSEAGEARCCLVRQSYCWHPDDCCDGYNCIGIDGTVCDSGDPNVCTARCCTPEVGVTCQSTEVDCCYPLVCTADGAGLATCQNPT